MATRVRITLLIALLCTIAPLVLHAQWKITNGPYERSINSMVVNGTDIFVSSGAGLFHSNDQGANWTDVTNRGSDLPEIYLFFRSTLALNSRYLFAGSDWGVFRSSDNGITWRLTDSILFGHNVYCLAIDGKNIYAGTDSLGVFRSTDDGTTWMMTDSVLFGRKVQAIAIDGEYVYAGTDGEGVYRSSNNGASWNRVDHPRLNDAVVSTFAFSGSYIFVGTLGDVYRSSNNGATWENAGSGLFGSEGRKVYALLAHKDELFAGMMDGGVYHSTDNGTSWKSLNDSWVNDDVMSLGVSGGELYAGTGHNGVFRRPLPQSIARVGQEPSTESFINAMQMYPNPVISSGMVSYHLERHLPVTVSIVDPLGRIVAQPVVDAMQEAGEHEIAVETEGLAPGVYLCGVKVGGVERTVRFVVVR